MITFTMKGVLRKLYCCEEYSNLVMSEEKIQNVLVQKNGFASSPS